MESLMNMFVNIYIRPATLADRSDRKLNAVIFLATHRFGMRGVCRCRGVRCL